MVGVPVAAPETCEAFQDEVDEIVCAITPEPFYAVGMWYEDFAQTTDDEVRALLREAARGGGHGAWSMGRESVRAGGEERGVENA